MKILERRTFRGPNLYAHFPVMRMLVGLGELENWPTAKIPGFVDKLLAALPGLQVQGVPAGAPQRARYAPHPAWADVRAQVDAAADGAGLAHPDDDVADAVRANQCQQQHRMPAMALNEF